MRFGQKIFRYALIRSGQDLVKHGCCGPQSVIWSLLLGTEYTNRQTDVTERYFVRVDVSEEFPFLVTKMSPYYDR